MVEPTAAIKPALYEVNRFRFILSAANDGRGKGELKRYLKERRSELASELEVVAHTVYADHYESLNTPLSDLFPALSKNG